ncbi:serine/arginine repetitive matrix protein 2-like [Colletes gigas]|uniref:serine/arginine repetitive matrix protein 2-like n=1 Tax=Colletes gigas TaxID=935657 RepID=UPI001C9AE69D|nr:serine/arginine repetitive matrix protein 2-like [Colletes gigas]
MAKRRIENRRSSRYSRSDYSSGILDPNTEIFGDERPYWWKDVENNTIARLSMGPDIFGETTANLDSISMVDINTPRAGWWKVLETPNTSTPLPVARDHSRKDAVNRIISTSESEEESRIAKRKRSLKFKTRNTKSNAFVSALNSSKTSLVPEPVRKKNKGSTVDSNASTEYNVNVKRLHKVRRSSSNDSQSTDVIVKLKPRIFEKKRKAPNTNIFDNILKEDELQSLSKERISSTPFVKENRRIQRERASMERKTASPIVNRSRLSKFSLSNVDEHNSSAPNAQSTLLENNSLRMRDSNKDSVSSDTEPIILKPPSRFLKRRNKIAERNVFKNVLVKDEVDSGKEINESANKNVARGSNRSKRSLISSVEEIREISQPVPRNIATESRTEHSKQNPFLDILQEDDNVDPHETSGFQISFNSANNERHRIKSAQSLQRISKSKINDQENNEILSTSHLNHATTSDESIKPNTNSSKSHSQGTVSLSQSVDDEDETLIDSAVSLIGNSKEKSLNQDSPRKPVSRNENEPAVLEENNMEDNQNKNWLNLRVVSDSEEEEFELAARKPRKRSSSIKTHSLSTKQNKKSSKSQNQSNSAILTEKELDEIDNNAKRQSKNSNKSQKLSVSRITRDSDAEDVEDVSRKRSKNLSNSNRLSSSAIIHALKQSNAGNTDEEQNNKFNMSPALTLRNSSSFHEEGMEYSPRRQTRNLNTSRNRSVSAIANKNEQSDVDNTATGESKNVSRLPVSFINKELETEERRSVPKRQSPEKRSVINREEEAQDSDESILTNPNRNPNTIDKQNRTTSKSLRQSMTRIDSDSESEDETPKKQSKRLSRSRRSDLYISNNVESNEIDDTRSKKSKNISKLQRWSALRNETDSESEDQIRLKRQSKRLSRLQNQSISAIMEDVESNGIETDRHSRKINESLRQSMLDNESDSESEDQTPSKRESKRLNTSQTQANVSSKLSIPDDPEPREIESDGNRQGKKINESQRQSILHIESDSEPEIQRSSKRQSRKLSRLQKKSVSGIADEPESDGTDNATTRQSKRITQLTSHTDSNPVSKVETPTKRQSKKISQLTLHADSNSVPQVESPSKRQSKRLSRLQRQSISDIEDKDESGGTDNAINRQSKKTSQVTLQEDSNAVSKVETPTKRQSKTISQLTLHTDGNSVPKVETPTKRQSKTISQLHTLHTDSNAVSKVESPSKSKGLSRLQGQSISDIEDKDESGGTDNAMNTQSKRIGQVTLQEDSNLVSQAETPSKRQSKRLSIAQKRSVSDIEDKDESGGTDNAMNTQSKRIGQVTLQEDSNLVSQAETPSKRQSKRLSIAQKRSVSDIEDKDESGGTDNAINTQSKRIGQVTLQEDSNLVSQVETPTKRQSKRSGKSQKRSLSDIEDKDEPEETDNTTTRQSKRIGQVTLQEDSNLVSQVETPSKRQSKRSSRAQKQSLTAAETRRSKRIGQVTLQEDSNLVSQVETPSKRQSKRSSRAQKQSLTAAETRRSKRISKPHHQSTLQTDSNSISKIETPPKTQSKILNFEKELAVKVVDIALSYKVGDTASKQNEGKSESQRQSTSNTQSEAESEVEAPLNKSGNIPDKAAVDDVEPDQTKDTTEMHSRLSLEKELTEIHADNSSGNKSQDDINFQLSYTSSNVSNIRKQVTTISKSKDRSTSDLDIHNTKGSEDASDAEDVREANKESLHGSSYKAITNEAQNVDKDLRTLGTIFAPSDAHNSRTAKGNISTHRAESNKDQNLIISSKIPSVRTPVASTSQRNIMDFLQTTKAVPMSQVLSDKQKLEEVNRKMEELKARVLDKMNVDQKSRETKIPSQVARTGDINKKKRPTQKKQPSKEVNKAFLVNGQVYKVPRLARPKPWVTKHLYNYLWKCMEPKYGLNTRVISEKFINELSQITTLILKKKSYSKYRPEMQILMKEMARLGIIENRNDFYHFCQDFFPYELRIKLVPMLLPGNKKNFPFDLSKLYKSLNDN